MLPFAAIAEETRFPLDQYRFQDEFLPDEKELRLSKSFLIPNSETVTIQGENLTRNVDYEISYVDGIIELAQIPKDTVLVSYEIFPWNLRHYYYHRTLPEPEKHPLRDVDAPLTPEPIPEESSFRFNRSGSVFRSITVGSERDASLESGMELKLNGRLGKGTTITAGLSDQNIPLQPEGDTRTLEEIDKIYVNIQSENLGLNLGDYNLSIEGREFAGMNRKLTGAQGYADGDNFQAMISGATSKGEFRSVSFNGVDGLQGPYQLTGKRGETGILILAGTERVWVDGILKIRGDNYDYIIDYSYGEISFTERVPIDSESRIVVDFQYSAGDYSRNLYHSAGALELNNDKLRLSYALAHEADSRDNPLSVSLTDEAKAALKSSGDNQYGAILDGAVYVGPGEGDYSDSSGIYVWAGRDSGDFDVSFSFIGYGMGSYQREYSTAGEIYYQWVGEGFGDYDAVILLPPPQSHEIADFGLSYQPRRGVEAKLEGAVSRLDRNTFSAFDDGDNVGYAYTGNLALDSLTLPEFIGDERMVGLNLKTRNIETDFRRIDRIEEAEYNRRWGYEDSVSQREESYNLLGYLIPFGGLRLSFGGGAMSRANFNSTRREAGLDYLDAGRAGAHLFAEDIRSEAPQSNGYWRRAKTDMWRRWGIFKPGICFEGEDRSIEAEGFRFGEYRPSLKIGRDKGLLTEYTYREDELRTGGSLQPNSVLHRGHILFEDAGRNSSITIDYTHSERKYTMPDSADVISDLGRIEYNRRAYEGAVNLSLKHRITQSRTAQTALIPIEVGWGEGNYVKEGDQYFPDPNGNYLLISQSTGEFIPSSKVKSSINLRLDFRKMRGGKFSIPTLLKLISTETFFSVEEESGVQEPWRLYLLYLPAFRSDSTLYGNQTVRQDIHYRKGDRDFSLRLRIADHRSLNNRLVSAGERIVRDEYSVHLWKSLSAGTSLQTMVSHSRERRWLEADPRRDILFNAVDNLLHQQITRPLEIRLGFKMETALERVDDIRSLAITLNPQANYSIFKRGRITIDGSWTGVYSEADNIPYEMTAGRGKGSNYTWGSRVGYRLGKNLNLTASYDGESKVGRPVIHTGRMELRAFF